MLQTNVCSLGSSSTSLLNPESIVVRGNEFMLQTKNIKGIKQVLRQKPIVITLRILRESVRLWDDVETSDQYSAIGKIA